MTEPVKGMGARLLRLPRTLFEFVVLYLALLLLGLMLLLGTVLLALRVVSTPRARRRTRARAAVSDLFRIYLNILGALGILRVDLSELESLRDAGPLVVAPNHPSMLDAVLMLSRMPNATCIMKASLTRNVFLGRGARLAGYIENTDPRTMVRQAVQRLEDGGQLLVFPEGTRTISHPVNSLKGAFSLIAKRSGCPVQIVFIESNSGFLGKGWPLWRRPDLPLFYRARLGPRIDPMGLDTDEIKRRTSAVFMRELADEPASGARPYAVNKPANDLPIDA